MVALVEIGDQSTVVVGQLCRITRSAALGVLRTGNEPLPRPVFVGKGAVLEVRQAYGKNFVWCSLIEDGKRVGSQLLLVEVTELQPWPW